MGAETVRTYGDYPLTARGRNITSDILSENNHATLEDHRDFLFKQLEPAVKKEDDLVVFPIMAAFRLHGNPSDGTILNKYTEGTSDKIATVARKAIAEIMIREQNAK